MENITSATETSIYYSKSNILRWLLFCVFLEGLGIRALVTIRPLTIGSPFIFLFCIGGLFGVYRQLRLLRNVLLHNRPQLTISSQGIRLASQALDSWAIIQEEEIRKIKRGRGIDTVLYYTANGEARSLAIRELSANSSQLTSLLRWYRAQFNRQQLR